MYRILLASAALTAGGMASAMGSAQAQHLNALEAAQINLGGATFSAYYVPMGDGYHLVTTEQSGPEKTVTRFTVVLRPGQEVKIEMPRDLGKPSVELRIDRVGNQVEIRKPTS